MREQSVQTTWVAKKLEWFGMTVVKRYLSKDNDSRDLRDVHSNPEFYDKGIDLVLNLPNLRKRTIDLKVDSYIGSDPSRKIRGLCNPDSGFILLETISQLQYDRLRNASSGTLPVRQKADVPGWFFTSSADEVYYYFLALLNSENQLNPLYEEYVELVKGNQPTDEVENRLLRELRVDRDLLVTFSLSEARAWYETVPETMFHGYAPAPNPSYLTLSKRVKRDLFISNGIGKSHGSIFSLVKPRSASP
ncbi:MAG TPA: hypothetical protein VGS11_03120 [Candidatus Bathyarchaeia archaeon]|nr:hypothetical protein [Candidatus Bathyarchaeia archaeon]